jgi:hypothetical protein
MTQSNIIHCFSELKAIIHDLLNDEDQHEVLYKAERLNPWFTQDNLIYCLTHWEKSLDEVSVSSWLENYSMNASSPKKIGLILAGNIPLVGLHDVLCVIASGNKAVIKLSSQDEVLIPYILNAWSERCAEIANTFEVVDRLKAIDAVIATGSNNTSRYFEQYFGSKPHIFRRNRTSCAILSEHTNAEDLMHLGNDIFRYFGLGCRNVGFLWIHESIKMDDVIASFDHFEDVKNHYKYFNNFEYQYAITLLNKVPHYTNGYIIVKESNDLFSPLATLHYKRYRNIEEVEAFIRMHEQQIQCIASNVTLKGIETFGLGECQQPALNTYADGIDTMRFLSELNNIL